MPFAESDTMMSETGAPRFQKLVVKGEPDVSDVTGSEPEDFAISPLGKSTIHLDRPLLEVCFDTGRRVFSKPIINALARNALSGKSENQRIMRTNLMAPVQFLKWMGAHPPQEFRIPHHVIYARIAPIWFPRG